MEGIKERMTSSSPSEAPRQPVSVPELWENYFLLKEQQSSPLGTRLGNPDRPLERIGEFLRHKDRDGLRTYLDSALGSVASSLCLDPLDNFTEAPWIGVAGTAMPGFELRLRCADSEYQTRTSPTDGRFEFRRIRLAPGRNLILVELIAAEAMAPAKPYRLWRSALERLYGEQTPTWRADVGTYSCEIEFTLPFIGLRDPVSHQEWRPEDLEGIVRCPTCGQYTRSSSWHGHCPLVETLQCSNYSDKRFSFKEDGFYPALETSQRA